MSKRKVELIEDSSGSLVTSTGIDIAQVSGSIESATKLKTARTIALSGDVTGSIAFDGTVDKTITAVVVNDKGEATASIIKGPVAREAVQRFPTVGKIASIVVWLIEWYNEKRLVKWMGFKQAAKKAEKIYA